MRQSFGHPFRSRKSMNTSWKWDESYRSRNSMKAYLHSLIPPKNCFRKGRSDPKSSDWFFVSIKLGIKYVQWSPTWPAQAYCYPNAICNIIVIRRMERIRRAYPIILFLNTFPCAVFLFQREYALHKYMQSLSRWRLVGHLGFMSVRKNGWCHWITKWRMYKLIRFHAVVSVFLLPQQNARLPWSCLHAMATCARAQVLTTAIYLYVCIISVFSVSLPLALPFRLCAMHSNVCQFARILKFQFSIPRPQTTRV